VAIAFAALFRGRGHPSGARGVARAGPQLLRRRAIRLLVVPGLGAAIMLGVPQDTALLVPLLVILAVAAVRKPSAAS